MLRKKLEEKKMFEVKKKKKTPIPIHPISQFGFAFTYEEKKYPFTRLLQSYCESPTIYYKVMSSYLSKFEASGGSKILLSVD